MNVNLRAVSFRNCKPKKKNAVFTDMKRLSEEEIRENAHYIKRFKRKYGFVFRPASYLEVPFASKVFSDDKISSRVFRIEWFLLNTFVIDMGTNLHREMSVLRHSFTRDEYKWHQTHNKLSANRWGIHFLLLITLNRLLNRNDLLISPDIESLAPEYNKFSFDEKVSYCSKIDAELYRILETLRPAKT